jgi:O-antigen/teichoic acid export membrane protein
MIKDLRAKVGQLFATPTRINAVTSYVMQVLSMIFGILSVRLAYVYLDQAQYGIWTLFSFWMGMLVLMDFGVSTGASRMLAEPVRSKDQHSLDMWWTTIVLVLLILGGLMLVIGLLAEPFIFGKDKVPPQFAAQASGLWRLMVISNAIKLPFQAYAGILFCQNRFYQMNLSIIAGSVVNMVVFYLMLKLGWSLNAYTIALGLQLVAMVVYWWASVHVTGIKLHIRRDLFRQENVKQLFGYSGSMFVYAIAGQIPLACQAKIVEDCLGLSAVAAFGVAIRASVVLAQLLQRTQEAKVPGWWQLYDGGERESIVSDRRRLMRWFVPLVLFSAVGLMMYNRSFVSMLTGPVMNLGRWFDVFLAITMVLTQYLRSTHFIFPLVQKTWRWALVSLADSLLQVLLGYWLIHIWGAPGLLLGALISMALTSLPFSMYAAPELLHVRFRTFFKGAGIDIAAGLAILAVMTWAAVTSGDSNGWWPLPLEWAALLVVLLLAVWTALRFRQSVGNARPDV